MSSKPKFKLRSIQKSDSNFILEWRNSERIRSFSYNDQIIEVKEHRKWFESVKNSKYRKVLIFEADDEPLGLVQFFDIDLPNRRCKWGFYLGSDNLPKGTGSEMGKLALAYAFDHLGVERIDGEAISHNQGSIKFHQKMGFAQEGIIEKQIYRDERWLDIILFSITRKQWEARV